MGKLVRDEITPSTKTEIFAGVTTFMTMAYILAVNPNILGATGMDTQALFTATALSALIGTLIMALYAKLPFALAPGMGLNAFFAFSVVIGMKYSWKFALTAVFLEGLIFILLTFLRIREAIYHSIPENMKKAVSVGIGLFIAFIGLKGAGIIVDNPATFVALGDMKSASVLTALFGVLFTGFLLAKKIRGALFFGIIATTIVGIPFGVTVIPEGFKFFSLPPSIKPIFFQLDFGFLSDKKALTDMIIVLFSFLFVDLFDTLGTLIGVSSKTHILDGEDGKLKLRKALFTDAIATTIGAVLGTSTVTTYVESAAGVAEGGRTGKTSLTTAGLFFLALFFSPLFLMIPSAATAPALMLVGLFMISNVIGMEFEDITEGIPAFLTIILMPLTFSIAHGIMFGILSYVFIKLVTGKHKEVSITMYVLSVLFILKFIYA